MRSANAQNDTVFADIIDGNLKLILGMIWTLILRFTIADIKWVALVLASLLVILT